VTDERIEKFASLGIRWITFDEGTWEGHATPNYVYCGTEPLAAKPATEVS